MLYLIENQQNSTVRKKKIQPEKCKRKCADISPETINITNYIHKNVYNYYKLL
jgi:hypothetical protein